MPPSVPSAPTRSPLGDLSITAAYPRLLMQLLAERGIDPEALLQALGLDLAKLDAADARVTLPEYACIAQAAMDAAQDEGLGCALALRTPPTAHGPLGYAMMTADTMGDALALGMRYMPLLQGKALLYFQMDEDELCLRPEFNVPVPAPLPLKRFFIEAFMVGIARSAAWLLGVDKLEGELWLDYPTPSYHDNYAAMLPRVLHGMPQTQLRLSTSLLHRKLPLADKASHERALAQCDREMAWLAKGEVNLCARVRDLLGTMPGRYPTVEEVAGRLHLSTRTLKRKLEQQGTTYRTLLEEARHMDAIKLLRRPQLTLAEVAQELGYTDPANFTRAFKRWTGATPSDFRLTGPR